METKGGITLSRRNLWAFSIGGIGRDMTYYLYNNFLFLFITFTKILTVQQFALMNVIMVVYRIWDAVNDPIMGGIVEATKSRFGKFKPWILIGAFVTAISIIGLFCLPATGWNYVVLFAVFYFLLDIGYTMNDIGYWAMLPALAREEKDRNRLTSFSALWAGFGMLLATMLVPLLTAGDFTIGGSANRAYFWVAIGTAFFLIAFQSMTCFCVKEKRFVSEAESRERQGFKALLRVIKNNDQLLWTVAFSMIHLTGLAIVGAANTLYIYITFGYQGILGAIVGALGGMSGFFVMLFYPRIAEKFRRKQLVSYAVIAVVIGNVLLLLSYLAIPAYGVEWDALYTAKLIGVTVAAFFTGISSQFIWLVIVISFSNCVEYNDLKTGQRNEAAIFSLRPFVVKMSSALGQLGTFVIYITTGLKTVSDGIASAENAANKGLLTALEKDTAIRGILSGVEHWRGIMLISIICLIPVVCDLAALYVYRRKCALTEERYADINAQIAERDAALISAGEMKVIEE
ncbi:melibiose:sodium transporter MelB [Spirochaetia bacterium]|nr:melibiose:sodium transporter MelB [Spirochaetia bacterium]